MHFVSIILPTYNRAHYLIDCIQSVLQQTFPHFELIIVDDGSEDNTTEVVQSIKDERIKYLKVDHTANMCVLKNLAIRHSKGDLIAFIDSDDMWKQNKLEKQVDILKQNPSVGFCITDVVTYTAEKVVMQRSYALQDQMEIRSLFPQMKRSQFIIYNPTLVMRKSCLDQTGFFNETIGRSAYHFNMLLSYYFEAAIIYEPLVWRRVHDSNISNQSHFRNYNEYLNTFEDFFKSGKIEKKYLRLAKANAYHKLGNLYLEQGSKVQARKSFATSFRSNPFQRKNVLSLVYSLF